MKRFAMPILAAILCAPAGASAHEGGYLQFGYGYTFWSLDRQRVADQVAGKDDVGQFFDASLHDAQGASFRGGYNILGHAHVGVSFLATGWNITQADRGGAGFLGGEVGWHPFGLVNELLKKKGGLRGWEFYDLTIEGGYGYSLVGQHRAMDGGTWEFGLGAEVYPAPWFSLGLKTTWYFTSYDRYIIDYDHRADPGNTVDLPRGSGGHFFVPTFYMAFHFGYRENRIEKP
jgi:hypothetical protein